MSESKLPILFLTSLLIALIYIGMVTANAETPANTLTLEFLGYENGFWKVKYSISIVNIGSSSGVVNVKETKWEPSEQDYVITTINNIGSLSGDDLFTRSYHVDYIITIKAPKGYKLFVPFAYRYKVEEASSNSLRIRVPYNDFFGFVRYEAIIVYNPSTINVINVSGVGLVIYTSDVPESFAKEMAEVLKKGRNAMLAYLGPSPLAPRCIVISGPSHHKSYPRGSMHSISGSTAYIKLWTNRNIDYSWYVKNLLHELAHGWYVWPLVYGDFDLNEGGAEFASWYFTRTLYPQLYEEYERGNILYRIKSGEKYAIAAIRNLALDYFVRKLSSKLGYNLTIFNITQYIIKHNLELISKDEYPQHTSLRDVATKILPKFLAEKTKHNEKELASVCEKAWQLIENLEYTQTYPYFDTKAIDSLITSLEHCKVHAVVYASNELKIILTNLEDHPTSVEVYIGVEGIEFNKSYKLAPRSVIVDTAVKAIGNATPKVKIFCHNLFGERKQVETLAFTATHTATYTVTTTIPITVTQTTTLIQSQTKTKTYTTSVTVPITIIRTSTTTTTRTKTTTKTIILSTTLTVKEATTIVQKETKTMTETVAAVKTETKVTTLTRTVVDYTITGVTAALLVTIILALVYILVRK